MSSDSDEIRCHDVVVIGGDLAASGALLRLHPAVPQTMRLPSRAHRIGARQAGGTAMELETLNAAFVITPSCCS
ncbi:MAG: hypothetical protein WAK82_40065 [Streptosporangiaceae bacterium]